MGRTVTEADLATFVGLAGFFEEIFINRPHATATTPFMRQVVPGQLTLVLAEGLYVLTGRLHHGRAFLGLTDLSIAAPVACGDTIRAHITVESLRRTKRPGYGIVITRHRVLNQDSAEVMTYTTTRMIEARL
jgi:acyl dehydratase